MEDEPRFIHLLFAPTQECSMRCTYCYLDHDRMPTAPARDALETLNAAICALRAENVVPFALSLHGGEVTCLPPARFEALVAYIESYYRENAALIAAHGFPAPRPPHIKTNLLGIGRHLDAIARHNVSASGSLDLPLSLHRAYRLDRAEHDTLDQVLASLKLFEGLPNRVKASATIFSEHLARADELIADIRWLHENTCLDMNEFNFMIGFSDPAQAGAPGALTPLTPEEQVRFFTLMHEAFDGTELDHGVNGAWFAEFTPDYCTGCANCGEKFFLLDAAGDVYSCVRGQGHEEFFYGNIFRDPVERILKTAKTKIFLAHNRAPLDEECANCPHLHLCRTGCPFVKTLYSSAKSYTCLLQKELYRTKPDLYPPSANPQADAYLYALKMHPIQAASLRPANVPTLPNDIPPLLDLIAADKQIAPVFDASAFRLVIDGETYPLESQVLRPVREIACISRESDIVLYVRKDILEARCTWPANNAVYLMLLSGDTVVYGDEGREKQEHVMTHQVFTGALSTMPSDDPTSYRLDLAPLLAPYYDLLSRERPNNLFVTTTALREAHYAKHKENAFYHIQTINLPFPNLELVCDDEPEPTSTIRERSV